MASLLVVSAPHCSQQHYSIPEWTNVRISCFHPYDAAVRCGMIRGIKEALYTAYFKTFPALASARREYKQGATKTHRSSFGLNLVGPEYLIDSSFEQGEIRLVT